MSQADFEKSYAELRKPLKMKPLGKAPSLESTVRAGDVETIERILAGGKLEKFRNEQEYPASVTYAMAHWLVDNSGRADLARRWMEATDHTPDLAAKHFEKLSYGDVWQKLVLQRCLGMSTLVDIFSFTPQHEDAPYHQLLNLDQDPRRYAAMNTLLASILRMNHPELPPDVSPFGDAARQQGRREPLIHHLWTAMSADKHLPSIEMAYGTQHPYPPPDGRRHQGAPGHRTLFAAQWFARPHVGDVRAVGLSRHRPVGLAQQELGCPVCGERLQVVERQGRRADGTPAVHRRGHRRVRQGLR